MNASLRWALLLALLILAPDPANAAERIRVVTTVPDLADLARQVGGDAVEVRALVVGPQDPHFIDPRPSFVRRLHDADLYIEVGMELEIGWAPVLLQGARNPRILPGGDGYLNASSAIQPLEVPRGRVDRSMGDVHVLGNPHYLMDPLNGWRVAALIRDRLERLAPDHRETFHAGFADLERRLFARLVGSALAARIPAEELAAGADEDDLETWLRERGEATPLGGWLGATAPLRGTPTVEDHQQWVYFAERFGLRRVATLEPRPGIAPTTRQLTQVVEIVEREKARLILSSPYFDPRHARWVAEHTGARVALLAHQVSAREGTGDYLALIDYNVRAIIAATSEGATAP